MHSAAHASNWVRRQSNIGYGVCHGSESQAQSVANFTRRTGTPSQHKLLLHCQTRTGLKPTNLSVLDRIAQGLEIGLDELIRQTMGF